ncbi:hypothetical protein V9K67_24570 [Paraflavisolibacter sp. H34]|uniref:hypothetical protein n=1 Tax=Huijunlia imazamoxiresistens TaxID=3127457 RepID=UPI0030161DA5
MGKPVSEVYLRKLPAQTGALIARLQGEFGEHTASKAVLRTLEGYFPLKEEKRQLEGLVTVLREG